MDSGLLFISLCPIWRVSRSARRDNPNLSGFKEHHTREARVPK